MYHIHPQDALVLLNTISSTLTAALELFSIHCQDLTLQVFKKFSGEPKAHSQLIKAVFKKLEHEATLSFCYFLNRNKVASPVKGKLLKHTPRCIFPMDFSFFTGREKSI